MFQTEPVKFLQSFATDWLTELLSVVSRLGYSSFYIPILIVILFGLSFRKGFLLTQMMIWLGITTDLLKNVVAFPRPADVDSGVRLLAEGVPNPTPFTGMGGTGFWDLPDPEAIRVIRAEPDGSFGIPSGHVGGATTFWGGLSLLFRSAALRATALAMILLMPLSRMYLGRHFLADVLAGFLLGAACLAVSYLVFIRPGARGRLLELARLRPAASARAILLPVFLLGAPLGLLALAPLVEPEDAGRLFGLNLSFLLLAWEGLPVDTGSWPRRLGRVVLAFVLYLCAVGLVGLVMRLATLPDDGLATEFLATAIPTVAGLWGGVRAGLALKLYAARSGRAALMAAV
jgi:membrane-associated phospholipid phosphatase